MSARIVYKDKIIKFFIDTEEKELRFTLNCALILEKTYGDMVGFYEKLRGVTVCADTLCVMANEKIKEYNEQYRQNEKPLTLSALNKMLDVESMEDVYAFIGCVNGLVYKEQQRKSERDTEVKKKQGSE